MSEPTDTNGDPLWYLMWPGSWENEISDVPALRDWYAIGHAELGIVAYAWSEPLAEAILAKLESMPPCQTPLKP